MHLQTAPTKNSLLVSFTNAEWLEASFSISCPNLKETTETVKSLVWQGCAGNAWSSPGTRQTHLNGQGTLSVAMAARSNYMSDQGWSKCTENLHH